MSLCDPVHCSPPGFSVLGILHKNTGIGYHFLLQGIFLDQGLNLCLLHWHADSLPLNHQGSVSVYSLLSRVRLLVTPLTVAHQAPLSMELSRQEDWSGYHSLLQEVFPTQGSNPDLSHCRWILYCLSQQGSLLDMER